ncbi:right-handed parallel beta-helix repeat-containing protein [Aquisphaera insulae]|uniref:right-handed parallel beta-helix repeat-containing protein n=1 Tax=Aquisphaera insulae TaxID=2712864 RepID=UPI0013E9BCB3|nr:right-handed parallel beta-helix repeat-containing protein [Aquisphaera insulae]
MFDGSRRPASLARQRARRGGRIGVLERLEARSLLSGTPTLYTVTDLGDRVDDLGSLRHAIAAANADANPAGSLVTFDPALFDAPRTIGLASTLELSGTAGPMVIQGPGAGLLTISGNDAVRVMQVDAGVVGTISGLTVSRGLAPTVGLAGVGGGLYNAGTLEARGITVRDCSALPGYGGGIYNAGTMTIVGSTIAGNRTVFSGGGIWNDTGRTMTIVGSTISGNTTTTFGGGIYNSGTLGIVGSTLSGNTSGYDAGAIENTSDGRLTITSSTLAGNSSGNGAGGISGGGALVVRSDIFANPGGNVGGGVVTPGPVTSLGHNLFTDAPGFALDPTDLTGADPLLGPLADNGGPTATMALLPGSPAIDAGGPVMSDAEAVDQRGIPRTWGSAPDIGAFESRGFVLAIDSGDGQAALPELAFAAPLAVSVASRYGEPVAGGRVDFDAPGPGAVIELARRSATIDAAGRASVLAVAGELDGTSAVAARSAGAGAVDFTLTTRSAPTLIGVQTVGVPRRTKAVILTFSEPMDIARVQDPSLYHLAWAGPDRRPGTRDDRMARVRGVRYEAATKSVTLRLMPGRQPHRTLWLTIAGGASNSTGLAVAAAASPAAVGTGHAIRLRLDALRHTTTKKTNYQD